MGKSDTYKTTREFKFPNMTVIVHIPDLSVEERNKRMQAVYDLAAKLLRK